MYELPEGFGPKRRKKSKRPKGSPRSPQIKMQKRPRGNSRQQMHETDSQQDLQPSATFHKYKYPWYRPDDEDEEEGETELNIRFFNNFSRMGPLGGLARVGGTATVIMSLVFLIVSNFSLAATVIAHGIAGIMRNLGQGPERTKVTSGREARHLYSTDGTNTTTTTTTTTTITTNPPAPLRAKREAHGKLDDRIRAFSEKWTC